MSTDMSQGKNYSMVCKSPKYCKNYSRLPNLFSQHILIIRLNTDDTDQGRIQNSVKHLRCLRGFWKHRSSHRRFSLKIRKIHMKNTCARVFLLRNTKVLFKTRLQHRWFPVNFAKFLRTPILKKICERLLLPLTIFAKSSIFLC